jgi:hypothetical protein
MLNNSNVMEEWRNFYENAKSMSGRSRIFPMFHKYMKKKLAEVDQLLAQGESISYFQRSQMMFAPLFIDH